MRTSRLSKETSCILLVLSCASLSHVRGNIDNVPSSLIRRSAHKWSNAAAADSMENDINDYETLGFLHLSSSSSLSPSSIEPIATSRVRECEDGILAWNADSAMRWGVWGTFPPGSKPSCVNGVCSLISSNDPCESKPPLAECMGCTCDAILVCVPCSWKDGEEEGEKMLYGITLKRLFEGVCRKKQGVEKTMVFLAVSPSLPVKEDSLDGDDSPGGVGSVMEWVRDELRRIMRDTNKATDGSSVAIDLRILDSEAASSSAAILDSASAVLSREKKPKGERPVKDIPLHQFPNLIRAICQSFTRGPGHSSDNKNNLELRPLFHILGAAQKGITEEESNVTITNIPTAATEKTPEYQKDNTTAQEAAFVKKGSSSDPSDLLKNRQNEQFQTQLFNDIIQSVHTDVLKLEQKQQEAMVMDRIPILEFGRDCDNILKRASKQFDLSVDGKEWLPSTKKDMMRTLIGEHLLPLYGQQISYLREYYGRKYETALESLLNSNEEDAQKQELALAEVAAQTTQGFQTAAKHAVPTELQKWYNDVTDANWDFLPILQGLIQDMMEVTAFRQQERDSWSFAVDGEDDNDESSSSSVEEEIKKPMKWYQKLFARCVVLGVNYVQGWMALQAIRKSAMDRDRNMPKFPLF